MSRVKIESPKIEESGPLMDPAVVFCVSAKRNWGHDPIVSPPRPPKKIKSMNKVNIIDKGENFNFVMHESWF